MINRSVKSLLRRTGRPIINDNRRTFVNQTNGKIPKRMTFFWAGKTISWLRYMTLYSFVKLNPDWDVHLVTSNAKVKDKEWECHNEQDFMTKVEDKNDYYYLIKKLKITITNWKMEYPFQKRIKTWNDISPPHKCDFLEWKTLSNEGGYFSDMDILYLRPMDN
jgi:hypothetical protein